jgi:hypothetical protein
LLSFGEESFVFQFAIQKYKNEDMQKIILSVVYGCETWSFILREGRRLRAFEKRVLRRMFGPKRDEVQGSGEYYIVRSLKICTPQQILFGRSNREE